MAERVIRIDETAVRFRLGPQKCLQILNYALEFLDCGRRIVAIMLAFQAGDVGSIPIARSIKKQLKIL